jgi:hypothetical protein
MGTRCLMTASLLCLMFKAEGSESCGNAVAHAVAAVAVVSSSSLAPTKNSSTLKEQNV